MRGALGLSLLLFSGAALSAAGEALAVTPPAKSPAKPSAQPAPLKIESEQQLFAKLKQCSSAEDAHPIEAKLLSMFRASGSPSVDLLMTRAVTAQGGGDAKTARQLVEAVTKIAPNYAEGWHVRANMEQGAGDDTAALVSLQRAVLLNPRQFTALNELADMLEDYGDKAGALKLYRRALDLDPQLEGANQKVRELTQSVEGRDI
ncbi:MAG TPA: tetratricopeptide repeat protein [Rhizomicrobium sp.]|jgi:Tfp pilus assembly protein PilF|nr:tetratricopeptide repeat protein [Rhizomicrobium sp.]